MYQEVPVIKKKKKNLSILENGRFSQPTIGMLSGSSGSLYPKEIPIPSCFNSLY